MEYKRKRKRCKHIKEYRKKSYIIWECEIKTTEKYSYTINKLCKGCPKQLKLFKDEEK